MSYEGQKLAPNSLTSSPISPHKKRFYFDNFERIITKPKSERTQDDIAFMAKTLREFPFFSSLQLDNHDSEQLIAEFIDVMKCECFAMGETVFNYKDKGSKFYVILKGKVDVFLPKMEEEHRRNLKTLENMILNRIQSLQRRNSMLEKESLLQAAMDDKENKLKIKQAEELLKAFKTHPTKISLEPLDKLLNIQDHFKVNYEEMTSRFKKIKALNTGMHFGEIALTMDCPRSATVIACSDLLVASISRDDYKNILHAFEKCFQEKTSFFRKMIDYKSDEASAIAKFCYDFKEKRYSYGQKIFTQGDMPTEILIVKKGEVQMSVQETLEQAEQPDQTRFLKKKRALNKKIANLGACNFLGEKEALANRPYETSATSISNDTVVYALSIKEFQDLQQNYNGVFEKTLNTQEAKMAYFEKRLEDNHLTKSASKEDLFSPRTKGERRTSNFTSKQDISQVHSLKLIENRLQKITLPKLADGQAKQALKRSSLLVPLQRDNSLISLFSDFNPGTPLSQRSAQKSLPRTKGDSMCSSNDPTPREINKKEKLAYGEYFDTPSTENDLIKNSRPRFTKFLTKLNERKIQDAKTDPVGPMIRSKRMVIREKTQNSQYLLPSSQIDSSSDVDSCEEITPTQEKSKKAICSITDHWTKI